MVKHYYDRVLEELRDMGDKRTRKTMKRMGGPKGRHLGVSVSKLRKFGKKIGTDHKLAQILWTSKYIDAQILATLIADPKRMDKHALNRWVKEIDFWLVSEEYVKNLVLKTGIMGGRLRKWVHKDSEFVKLAGLTILRKWPKRDKYIDDKELSGYIDMIRKDFKKQTSDRVKQAMLWSLIAIGKRSPKLQDRALKSAKKLGKVKLDLGDGGGKKSRTPDVVEELTDGRVKARWETLVP
jgi:3-methyladenine DNA glycosylase AlkD